MAKIVCVLYPDPVDGYPTTYPRDSIPRVDRYPSGQRTPTPKAVDFTPGQLLGSVSGELGLRDYLEAAGHTFVVTSDKDRPDSVFEQELADADIVIVRIPIRTETRLSGQNS
jgi:formate dehydrogenase